ncbi:MAG: sodium-dependent transporter [Bdellovibrionales bacterium]|nr:sodium-dependent transporter [Bdellovibrionales bacterium]
MRIRSGWATRSGFYMAAIGSAFGLGNLWRFPYVVGTHGGGAFVVIYILCAFCIGLPILIAELMLGKVTQQSAINAISVITHHKKSRWLWAGRLAIVASLLLLAFYGTVSGWVLYFLMQFLMTPLKVESADTTVLFQQLMSNGYLQLALTGAHILIVAFVVSKGVRQGIERWVRFIMPVFFILLLFLMFQSLQLPGSEQALRFMFYPDFNKLTLSTLVEVLGHVFFTLSVGMGAMVAFGSYLQPDISPIRAGVIVCSLDVLISLLAGLLIFPIVFSGSVGVESGYSLLFETVPLLFSRMGMGDYFGIAFFLCLYTTALVASMGLVESSVSNLVDRYRFSRTTASYSIAGLGFILAILPSLSSSFLKDFRINDWDFITAYDTLLINWVLPGTAVGLSLFVGFKLNRSDKWKEFENKYQGDSREIFGVWQFVVRWLAPIVIALALAGELLDFSF